MRNANTEREFLQMLVDEKQGVKDAVGALLFALESADADEFAFVLANLELAGAWRAAFLAIRKWNGILPEQFQRDMSGVWGAHGWIMRSGVADDKLLADALVKLFRPYTAGDLVLYRGDSAANRRRRTYGLSWSSSEAAARGFAHDQAEDHPEGSVLLRAIVPATAIIADVHTANPEAYEFEYLVDRRRLKGVRVEVLERFPYSPRPKIDVYKLAAQS